MVDRARHIDDVGTGNRPKFAIMTPQLCREAGDVPARHVDDIGTGNRPKFATVDLCCDAYCADGTDCFVEKACYPTGPGISDTVLVYFEQVNCLYPGPVALYYDSGSGTWTNTFVLSGGTVTLTFSCNAGLPDTDSAKFRLAWDVTCGYDHFSAYIDAGYNCAAPLRIHFAPSSLSLIHI